MYVVAGEVVAAVSGRSWDDFVKERLLAPLGMTRSTTGLADSGAGDDFASPHVVLDGSVQPVTAVRIDNAAAAGGVHSSASEMARWVRMLLECGPGGKASGEGCLLSSTAIGEMWSPQTIRPISTAPRGLETLQPSFSAYGLGFGLLDHRGRKLVTHTGGLPGYVSRVALVPQERLGLVVLTNQEAEGAHTALLYHVLDLYLGAPKPPVDWVAAFKRAAADDLLRAKEAVAKASGARDAASRPSLTLSRYSGRYRDAWYGEAAVVEEQGRLVLRLSRTPRMVADLEHWQHDTFVARWRERFMSDAFGADAYVTFALNPDGSIERFRMAPVSPAVDFSFDYQDLLFTPLPAEGR
jgi:CubicO group peptidase (beta-lactamase class C family)